MGAICIAGLTYHHAEMTERRTTSISLSPAEEELLRAAMAKEGMTSLGTWMKSVCRRYAEGHLIQHDLQHIDMTALIHKEFAKALSGLGKSISSQEDPDPPSD